jgi:hypothetical protein
VLEQLGERLVE